MGRPSIDDDAKKLLANLPSDGTVIGNTSLQRLLKWEEPRYWKAHQLLLTQGQIGRGKGKGGSVYLLNSQAVISVPSKGTETFDSINERSEYEREKDLYVPLAKVLNESWAKDRGYDQHFVEVTAQQGRKDTGGRWIKPDLCLLGKKTYKYVPGKFFEIVTFEVKKFDSIDVIGVFEALSHRQFATLAYVIFCTGEDIERFEDKPERQRILTVAKEHGVGVLLVTDPKEKNTWTELVEPKRATPDPEQQNFFLGNSLTEKGKDNWLAWHK